MLAQYVIKFQVAYTISDVSSEKGKSLVSICSLSHFFVQEILCWQWLFLALSPWVIFENADPGSVCCRKLSKSACGSRKFCHSSNSGLSVPSAARDTGGLWKGLPIYGLIRQRSSETVKKWKKKERDKIVGLWGGKWWDRENNIGMWLYMCTYIDHVHTYLSMHMYMHIYLYINILLYLPILFWS